MSASIVLAQPRPRAPPFFCVSVLVLQPRQTHRLPGWCPWFVLPLSEVTLVFVDQVWPLTVFGSAFVVVFFVRALRFGLSSTSPTSSSAGVPSDEVAASSEAVVRLEVFFQKINELT